MRYTSSIEILFKSDPLLKKINLFMSLANKTFINNRTGETIKVLDTFENIAILENKQKIDVSILTDPTQFTPDIDPTDFFNDKSAYGSLLEKIKNIPTDNLVDDSIVEGFGGEVRPAMEESAVIMTTPEDEMAELARKYGVNMDNSDAIAKQQEAFSKYLDEDELPPAPVKKTNVEVNNVQQVEVQREYVQPPVQRIEVEDPILTMFKKTKRSVNFSVNIDYSNKIPRLDFIEMMEDSYETSMIDYLADEFTREILSNPDQIRDKIKDKIKQLVYGAEVSSIKKEEVKEEVKELTDLTTAKQRGEWVSKLNSIEEIEEFIINEKSKTVISSANKRIKELKNNK
jgi:hypothetical protein